MAHRKPSAGDKFKKHVKKVGSIFKGGPSRSSRKTDAEMASIKSVKELANEKLLIALLKSDLTTIVDWKDSWNFFGSIPSRKTKVTPLSILCRPQLCDALKECDHEQQLMLVQHALKCGADPWLIGGEGDTNARSITDTVYQGDVDILKLFIEAGLVKQQDLLDYRLYGASLLHMAAYDSRLEMMTFLVEEMQFDPKLKDDNGQQPLFWVFARGPVKVQCAHFLVELGCDPKESVPMYDGRGKAKTLNGCTLSPLSIAIGTFPEFVEDYLQSQFKVVSNRGLARTVRFYWQDLLVQRVEKNSLTGGKEFVYEAPRFAKILPQDVAGWETLNYDHEPLHQRTYVELMLYFKRKELLQFPIITKATYMMWNSFSYGCFMRQVVSFITIWGLVFVATFVWPSRQDGLAEMDADGGGKAFTSPMTSILCLAAAMPVVAYLWTIEYQEFSVGGRWKKYMKDFWNYADFFLLSSIIFLCVLVNTVNGSIDKQTFLWSDRAFCSLAVIVHLMFAVKGIQFAAVPKYTSHMVSMIVQMLGDVAKFAMVWVLLYLGYSQALWMLWKNTVKETELADMIAAVPDTELIEDETYVWIDPFIHLWNWMLGDGVGDFPETLSNMDYVEEQFLSFTLHYSWIIIMTIMLFNMLIAMMGNTYQTVADEQKAETILNFVERVQNLWFCAGKTLNTAHHKELWDKSDSNIDEADGTADYLEQEDDITPIWAKDLNEKLDEVMLMMKTSQTNKTEVNPVVKLRRASLMMMNKRQKRKRLYVKVVQAEELREADLATHSDPFVIVRVRKGDQVLLSDATQVILDNLNPNWQWVSGELFAEGWDNIEFCVMDKDKSSKGNDYLGSVVVTLDEINKNGCSINDWFGIMYKQIPAGKLKLEIEWVADPNAVDDNQRLIDNVLSPRSGGTKAIPVKDPSKATDTVQHYTNLLEEPTGEREGLKEKLHRFSINRPPKLTSGFSEGVQIHGSENESSGFVANPTQDDGEDEYKEEEKELVADKREPKESGADSVNIKGWKF